MRLEAKIIKGAQLIKDRAKIDRQLAKLFGNSTNGAKRGPYKRKNPKFVNHGRYLGIIKKLPASERGRLGKLYREQGVKAAVKAAQAAVEARS